MASRTDKVIVTAASLGAVLIVARVTRSPLITFLVNSLLARISGVRGRVGRADINFISPRIVLQDLSLLYDLNGAEQRLKVRTFELGASWKQLLKGSIETSSRIDSARLWLNLSHTNNSTHNSTSQSSTQKEAGGNNDSTTAQPKKQTWQDKIRQLPPFRIDSISLTNSALNIAAASGQTDATIQMHDLNVRIENLANSRKLTPTLLAQASGSARLMNSGDLVFRVEGYPLAESPTFNTDMTATNVDLTEFQRPLEELASIDIQRGILNLSLEAAAADGEIHGYVKPTFDHLKLEPPKPAGFIAKLKAYGLKLLARIGRNRRKDRIATRIDFDGELQSPQLDIGQAITKFVRNSFLTAEHASLDHRIWFARAGQSPQEVRIHYGRKKPSKIGVVFGLLKAALSRWSQDSASRMAAALAYYTAFSIAPLLLLSITIAGFVFGREAVQGKIVAQIGGLVGTHSATAIQSMIESAYRPTQGILASIISIISLIAGAIGVLSELKSALNQIWRTSEPGSIKDVVKRNVVFLGMMFGFGFLLAVSLIISTAIAAIGAFFGGFLPAPQSFLQIINFVFSFAVVWVLFAAIYRILPNTKIEWRDVWIGAAVTSLLFNLGKLGLGLYLGRSAMASEYGAAGSILIFLLWVYYSGLIFYFGAEFTAVYSQSHGSRANRGTAAKHARQNEHQSN